MFDFGRNRGHERRGLESKPVQRSDWLMGTLVSQSLYGIHGEHVAMLASAEIARLEGLFSRYRRSSEIEALRRNAGVQPTTVHADTFAILSTAKALSSLTQGAFDPTAGPLTDIWREALTHAAIPGRRALETARRLVDSSSLELRPDSQAFLPRFGQSLDLGGIGKGYAADRCRELYEHNGIRHALIDLGGNVTVRGGKPNGEPFVIGIQRPGAARGTCAGYLELAHGSVVTSGSYERYWELCSQRYSHIIDPRSGWPAASDVASATVVCNSSTRADALATACVVLGVERGLSLIDALPEVEAIVLDQAGRLHVTTDLRSAFRPNS